jgi:hypothetical protein
MGVLKENKYKFDCFENLREKSAPLGDSQRRIFI